MAPNVNANTIQYFGSSVAGMFDENSTKESRVQTGINIATKALDLVFGAISDAQSEAQAKVSESEKKNNNLQKSAEAQAETNKKAVQAVTDKIEENQNKITEILEQITDFEEEKEQINQEVKAHQEELQKQIAKYEKATTPEERKNALDAISLENKSIQELLGRVEALGNKQKELNEQGEEFKAANTDLQAESEEVRQDGENKIKDINAQAVVNKAEAGVLAKQEGVYIAKAAEYFAKAVAAKASGTASGFFSFGLGNIAGEAEYQRNMQLFNSNTAAAGIIASGVPSILSTIGNVFDGTNTNMGYLTNTSSLIGSLTAAAEGDVNSFFGISNSLGSWLSESTKDWNTTSENIDSAIEQGNQEYSTEQTGGNDASRDGDDVTNNDNENKKFNAEAEFNVDIA